MSSRVRLHELTKLDVEAAPGVASEEDHPEVDDQFKRNSMF